MIESVVQLPRPSNADPLRDQLIADIKKDFSLIHLYLAPRVCASAPSVKWLANQTGLSESIVATYRERFVSAGLWILKPDGEIEYPVDSLELGNLTVSDYLTLSTNIAARMSEDGPCSYESLMVATTTELKKEFLKDLHRCMRDFIQKSVAVEPDCVVGLTYGMLDCTKQIESRRY